MSSFLKSSVWQVNRGHFADMDHRAKFRWKKKLFSSEPFLRFWFTKCYKSVFGFHLICERTRRLSEIWQVLRSKTGFPFFLVAANTNILFAWSVVRVGLIQARSARSLDFLFWNRIQMARAARADDYFQTVLSPWEKSPCNWTLTCGSSTHIDKGRKQQTEEKVTSLSRISYSSRCRLVDGGDAVWRATMPHVAVYQSGNTTSIAGASQGPNAHVGLSLIVFFCINPPFGKTRGNLPKSE